MTDAGFHYSVLSEFRSRLLAENAEGRLLEVLLTHFKARGWLTERQRQRTDSTNIVAAVRSFNRLELVERTLQNALNALADVAPGWLLTQISPEWFDRYIQPLDDYWLPKEKAERLALAEQIGKDGQHLLSSIAQSEQAEQLAQVPAVVMVRQIWEQQYNLEACPVQWRSAKKLPPSAERIASPHGPQARSSTKRSVTWVGYKVHLTETCDEASPHLITHVETAPATEGDSFALPRIHEALARRELLPGEYIVDTTYGSADLRSTSQVAYGVTLVCPVYPDMSWQSQEGGAFPLSDFQIDWEAQAVTCPQGKISRQWKSEHGPRDKHAIQVKFSKADCLACSVRARCSRNVRGLRELTLHPREAHLALQAARKWQTTPDFKDCYDKRAGVEGTVSSSGLCPGYTPFSLQRVGKNTLAANTDGNSNQSAPSFRVDRRDSARKDEAFAFCGTANSIRVLSQKSSRGDFANSIRPGGAINPDFVCPKTPATLPRSCSPQLRNS